ncbi:FAD/NAD(P)-binding domain-containing protein [Thozetella sp. PMI_491]|nr:FAD/NAD(P)-binding domain-containing protein [Thozetella sp. PMI_491]
MASQTPKKFDYLALGTGEAGKYIAWILSRDHGKSCAAIERKWIGGSCPNIACLPSKNFLHSANVAYDLRQASSYGLGAYASDTEAVKSDMAVVKDRKVKMIHGPGGLMDLHLGLFKANNVQIIEGEGRFVGPKTIQVGDQLYTADNIAISTGSSSVVDARIPGLIESKPLTHIEALDLDNLPSHLIILGGGYIGIEFAQAFRRFGSQVTVVEHNKHVLKNEDADVVESLVDILKVLVTIQHEGNTTQIQGSHILVSAGRSPNTSNIGLEEVGIQLTGTGHVKVDEQLRTSVDGVFAVGDCAGSPHFTHVAFDDFRLVLSTITGAPRPGGTSDRQIPSALFTTPELVHVGLREHEAVAQGVKYRLAKIPMAAFLRTRTLGDSRGFAKALVEADGDRILGFTALGPSAGELLPVVQLAMKLGASYKDIASLIITHPTMAEGLVALFGAVPARAV